MTDDARKRKREQDELRRWGPNKVVLRVALPTELRDEYKATCRREGLSMNRIAVDLIQSFVNDYKAR